MVRNFVNGVVPWEAGDTGTPANQTPQNILLNTTVNDCDMEVSVWACNMERRLGGDLLNQVDLLRIDECLILIRIILLSNCDPGEGRTLLTKVGDNGPSVDTSNGGDTLTSTPVAERLNGSPVRVLLSDIGNNNTDGLEMGRLEVFQETILVPLVRGDTIVSNERLGEDENLATVGRIGKSLGISNEGSREDGFPGSVRTGTEGLSVEDRTVLGYSVNIHIYI